MYILLFCVLTDMSALVGFKIFWLLKTRANSRHNSVFDRDYF